MSLRTNTKSTQSDLKLWIHLWIRDVWTLEKYICTAYHEDCGQSDRLISITCTEWLQKVKHRKLKKELSGPYRPARPVVPFPALNLLQPLGITMTLTFMNSLIYFPTQDKVKEYIAYISWTVKIKFQHEETLWFSIKLGFRELKRASCARARELTVWLRWWCSKHTRENTLRVWGHWPGFMIN